jgi:5'-nucleotidase
VPAGPRILLTNDDGYDAPGLAALRAAIATLGELFIVAPDREQSGTSHSLTLHRPLRATAVDSNRFRVDGTPTDCVHLAIPRLIGGVPDLVVSGINRGCNLGDDVTYSGTVAGALEATLMHVPALAFSAEIGPKGSPDFEAPANTIRSMAKRVLETGLPAGVLLNVNFPHGVPKGVRVTRQGTRTYRGTVLEREYPAGRPYYWIDDADSTPTGEPDGDHVAIRDGYVSVTPLQANMTHEATLTRLSTWRMEWV